MSCIRMSMAFLAIASLTGCSVCRNIMFRDGTTMAVEVLGSHHLPFPDSGKIVFRNISTGEVLIVTAHVCSADLTLTLIEQDTDGYLSASEYMSMLKLKGWQWR